MISRRTALSMAAAGTAMLATRRSFAAPLTISPAGLIFTDIDLGKAKVRALVDTGSVRALQITSSVANALGIPRSPTGQLTQRYQGAAQPISQGTLAHASLIDSNLQDVPVFVAPGDIEAIAAQVGTAFDAILGWPLLSRLDVIIDYWDASIRNARLAGAPLAEWRLVEGRPLPVVAGHFNNAPIDFLIDTGAPWCNISLGMIADLAVGGRREFDFDLAGHPYRATFRAKDLSAMTRGIGAQAVIGHRFLADFRIGWSQNAAALLLYAAAPRR
ncbi:MAG: retroviral-like aspartic protease family protein [Sphingopyxis sp.]|nr:retroviral-like aspartic protease family protein [Sphingopyxis sp.]